MNIYDYSLIVTTCDMTPWFDCHKCILCSYNSSSITNKAKIVTFQFIMNIILHNARTDCPWCLLLPHHNFGHLKGFIHNHTPSREVYDIKLNYCKKNGYARLVIFIIFFITSGDLVMLMRITTTQQFTKNISSQPACTRALCYLVSGTLLFLMMSQMLSKCRFGHDGGVDMRAQGLFAKERVHLTSYSVFLHHHQGSHDGNPPLSKVFKVCEVYFSLWLHCHYQPPWCYEFMLSGMVIVCMDSMHSIEDNKNIDTIVTNAISSFLIHFQYQRWLITMQKAFLWKSSQGVMSQAVAWANKLLKDSDKHKYKNNTGFDDDGSGFLESCNCFIGPFYFFLGLIPSNRTT